MKKLLIVLLLLLPSILWAQLNHELLYNAYLSNDFEIWKTAIDEAHTSKMTIKQLEELVNYEYGYIGFCLDSKQTTEAQRMMTSIEKHVTTLENHHYQPAIVAMYRSALCAFKIKENKWQLIPLGKQSIEYAELAYEKDPKHPLIVSMKGNIDFFRPALLGGSKKNALYNYEKATELFENQNQTTFNWNYLANLLSMAQAYEKTGNLKKADLICKKILQIAPNFKYLNEVYYPQLLEKIEQNRLNPSPQCRDVACRVSTTNTVGDLTVQTERAPSLPNNVFLQTFAH